jgi:hypothetical protein
MAVSQHGTDKYHTRLTIWYRMGPVKCLSLGAVWVRIESQKLIRGFPRLSFHC